MNICVYGPTDIIAPKHVSLSRKLGKHLGKPENTIIFNGYEDGLPGIIAAEAWKNGATILSVLPESSSNRQKEFTHSTVIYCGNDKWDQKWLMDDCADAFIILPEDKDVVQELFDILLLKKYGRHNKPVYIINLEGQCDILIGLLEQQEYGGLYMEISEKELAQLP